MRSPWANADPDAAVREDGLREMDYNDEQNELVENMMLLTLLCAGLGGGLGAAGRVYAGMVLSRYPVAAVFPLATLAVNLVGCFLIGFLLTLPQLGDPRLKTFLTAGFLGGLTTFSTFGFDTLSMLERGEFLKAGFNAGVSIIAGLGCCYLGQLLAKTVCRA